MKSFIQKNLKILIAYLALFVLILIGTFADLQISMSLAVLKKGEYYTHSFFAVFLEILGEMPVYILPSIAVYVVMQYFLSRNLSKAKRYITVCVSFLIVFGLNFFAGFKFFANARNYMSLEWVYSGVFPYVLYTFFSIIFTILWYIVSMSLSNEKNLKNLAICALIIIFTAILSQVATQGIKPVALRIRYRYMNDLGNFSKYSAWYEFNANHIAGEIANKDNFMSFPSGHATASAMTFTLVLFTSYFGEFKNKLTASAINTIAILFPILVAFSRIEAGAHFLTDVCFGLAITLTAMLISKWIVNKWLVKYFK